LHCSLCCLFVALVCLACSSCLPFLCLPRFPPIFTLFPYTTLFRSRRPLWFHREFFLLRQEAFRRSQLLPRVGSYGLCPSLHCQRSEEHTSELQSRFDLVCRLLLEKKKIKKNIYY